MSKSVEIARFAELTWRTIKIRVSLLVLIIVGLLVIWSGVLTGDGKARVVDKNSCLQLVADQNRFAESLADPSFVGPQVIVQSDPAAVCTDQEARLYIEAMRGGNHLYEITVPSSVAERKLAEHYGRMNDEFNEYDRMRNAAYTLQIQLSSEYSSSSVTLNALTVAKVAPFLVLIFLTAVVILGIQQKRFKYQLSKLVSHEGNADDSAMAQGQYFVRPQLKGILNVVVLSPEAIVVWTLGVAAVLCVFGVLSAFVVNVVHLTDVIYGSYLSDLLSTFLLLTTLVIVTERAYAIPCKATKRTMPRNVRDCLEFALITVSLVSLLMPWTQQTGMVPALAGYRFAVMQTPFQFIGNVAQYPIAPDLYSQIRPQVDIALLFVVLCALSVAAYRYNWKLRKWLFGVRHLSGFATVYLSLNFILYMVVLEYESTAGMSWNFSNILTAPLLATGHVSGIGLPFSFYDPSYGFMIFLGSSFSLFYISFGLSDREEKSSIADIQSIKNGS